MPTSRWARGNRQCIVQDDTSYGLALLVHLHSLLVGRMGARPGHTSSMMSRYSSWSVMRGWCRPMYRSRFCRLSLSVPTSTTHGSTRLRKRAHVVAEGPVLHPGTDLGDRTAHARLALTGFWHTDACCPTAGAAAVRRPSAAYHPIGVGSSVPQTEPLASTSDRPRGGTSADQHEQLVTHPGLKPAAPTYRSSLPIGIAMPANAYQNSLS